MKEYDFGLIFKLPTAEENSENFLDPLYEVGCDDALVGLGKPGYLSFDFIREANSAHDAVSSAISSIKSVAEDSELIHVSPDLVGIRELKSIFQCTRQNIQKYINKSTFPNPEYKGSQAIWHLATVLKWFAANNHEFNQELLEIAELAMSMNLFIKNKTTSPQTLSSARELIHN